MPITTRATVLAIALLASAPLLAADSGATTAGTDVATQETLTTEQDDCWLPMRSSTDLAADQAGFLPKPGSTSPDWVEVDRHFSNAAPCVRPLGLWNDEPEDGVSAKRGYSATAMPAGSSMAWPRQSSFLEDSSGADGLSGVPAKAGIHF